MRVTASLNGQMIGSRCLRGPTSLPASIDSQTHSLDTSFTVTLPAAWLKPGLSLTVAAGSASQTLASGALKIGAAPIMTMYAPDLLF